MIRTVLNKENVTGKKQSVCIKGHYQDSKKAVYIKCPKEIKLQRQREDWWLYVQREEEWRVTA